MFTDEDLIYSYSREQAIADGVLIDLSARYPEICSEHYKWPVACTSSIWNLIQLFADEADGASPAGVVHDILWMSRFPIRKYQEGVGETCIFLFCIPEAVQMKMHTGPEPQLKIHVGPNDNGEPCITIMMPEED